MFHIYRCFVCVSRRQSSRTANNNFYPSSSITRYRLAASGNNSVTPKSSHAKKRASSILFFSPGPRQENRVSRNRVLTNSVLNERKLSTAVCAEIIFSSAPRFARRWTNSLRRLDLSQLYLFSDGCFRSLLSDDFLFDNNLRVNLL